MTPSELWNDNMKIKETLTQRHQYTVKNVSVDLTIKNAFSENKKKYIYFPYFSYRRGVYQIFSVSDVFILKSLF